MAPIAQLETVSIEDVRTSAAPNERAFIVPSKDGKPNFSAPHLTYHAQIYTLGLGAARDCPVDEMQALVDASLADASIDPNAIASVNSITLRADEPAILQTAERLGVPYHLFTAEQLEAEAPRLATPSDVVYAEVGCHGVAEGAALAAAGPESLLHVTKRKSANATCAIASAPEPIVALTGAPRGSLALVGIGPGQAAWRTPEASRLVAEAEGIDRIRSLY